LKLTSLTGEIFNQWVRHLEQELAVRFRESVKNRSNLDPVFKIDDIPARKDRGGFGIAEVHGPDLDATLRTYEDETGHILIDMKLREFRLTDNGRTYLRKMDTQIE
jgi:hypothetical protein